MSTNLVYTIAVFILVSGLVCFFLYREERNSQSAHRDVVVLSTLRSMAAKQKRQPNVAPPAENQPKPAEPKKGKAPPNERQEKTRQFLPAERENTSPSKLDEPGLKETIRKSKDMNSPKDSLTPWETIPKPREALSSLSGGKAKEWVQSKPAEPSLRPELRQRIAQVSTPPTSKAIPIGNMPEPASEELQNKAHKSPVCKETDRYEASMKERKSPVCKETDRYEASAVDAKVGKSFSPRENKATTQQFSLPGDRKISVLHEILDDARQHCKKLEHDEAQAREVLVKIQSMEAIPSLEDTLYDITKQSRQNEKKEETRKNLTQMNKIDALEIQKTKRNTLGPEDLLSSPAASATRVLAEMNLPFSTTQLNPRSSFTPSSPNDERKHSPAIEAGKKMFQRRGF